MAQKAKTVMAETAATIVATLPSTSNSRIGRSVKLNTLSRA